MIVAAGSRLFRGPGTVKSSWEVLFNVINVRDGSETSEISKKIDFSKNDTSGPKRPQPAWWEGGRRSENLVFFHEKVIFLGPRTFLIT